MNVKWASAVGVLLFAISCSKDPEVVKREAVAAGDKFVEQKKFSEAGIEYRKATAADPRFGIARFKLAGIYERMNDPANAMREYVRAADLMPKDIPAQLRAGQFLLLARQYPEARARALAALDVDPKNPDSLILLGNAMAGLKEYKGAVEQIELAIEQEPQRTLWYTNLGLLKLSQGERSAAESAFKRAVEAAPKSAEAHAALANYFWSVGRPDEAETELKTAYELDPKSNAVVLTLATFYVRNGRVSDGEKYLKEYVAASGEPGARLTLADLYLSQKRNDEALPLYEALTKEKGSIATDAKLRLASVDYSAGRKDKAHAAVDGLLQAEPKNEAALLAKARLFVFDNKPADALAAATKAVEANPQSSGALFLKSQLQESTGDATGAIATLQEFNKRRPGSYSALVRLGNLYLGTGDSKGANDFIAEALKLQPLSGPANLLRARVLIIDGKTQEAETILRGLLQTNNNSSEVHRTMGLLYLQRNDLANARTSYTRALELTPDSSEAITGLIQVDLAQKRTDLALGRLNARLARSTTPDAAFWNVAGTTYVAAGDAPKAEAAFRKVVEIDPANIEGYGNLATLYMLTKRVAEAKTEFERLATSTRTPTVVLARTVLGSILALEKKNEESRKQYLLALEVDPKAGVAANNLAWSYAQEGKDLDTALKYAQMAKGSMPKSWEVSDTLGWIYLQKKLGGLAASSFEQGAQQNPSSPIIHYHLGLAYVMANKTPQARQSFERALKLDASFEGADDARAQLAKIQKG